VVVVYVCGLMDLREREYRDISDRGVFLGNKGVISTTAVKKKNEVRETDKKRASITIMNLWTCYSSARHRV